MIINLVAHDNCLLEIKKILHGKRVNPIKEDGLRYNKLQRMDRQDFIYAGNFGN
jgi:hypothetical protein